MKKIFLFFVFFLFLSRASAQKLEMQEIVHQTSPALVQILTYDEDGELMGSGSGCIIHSNGVIATNFHVIDGASTVVVRLTSKAEHRVKKVLGYDARIDYAILKIDAFGLPIIPIGDYKKVQRGDEIVVLGYPMGVLDFSSTFGRVNCKGTRCLPSREIDYDIILFDAPISPGNSGGALINANGEVIGMPTFYWKEGQNLNYAISMIDVRKAYHISVATETSYTLQDLLVAKEQKLNSDLKSLNSKLEIYEDKNTLMLYPKNWKIQSLVTKIDSIGAQNTVIMFHPPSADIAQIKGLLSHGMKVSITYPSSATSEWVGEETRVLTENSKMNYKKYKPEYTYKDEMTVKAFGKKNAKFLFYHGKPTLAKEELFLCKLVYGNDKYNIDAEYFIPYSRLKVDNSKEVADAVLLLKLIKLK